MQCTTCSKTIQGEFSFCPHCGIKLNTACPGCGKNMMPEWVNCPYCGLTASTKAPVHVQPAQNTQYPNPSYNNQNYQPTHNSNYHSDSSGQQHKRKKGMLGSFFSS